MSVDRVRPVGDVELAAHWKHGWIPLNAEATAIKLKHGFTLHHGGRMHAGMPVYHKVKDSNGNHIGSVIERPGGKFHYRHSNGFDGSVSSKHHSDPYRNPKDAGNALIRYHRNQDQGKKR